MIATCQALLSRLAVPRARSAFQIKAVGAHMKFSRPRRFQNLKEADTATIAL